MNALAPSNGALAPAWIHFAAACTVRLPRGRSRMATLLSRCHRGAFWARLPKDLGEAWYWCNLADGISAEVYFAGCYEPQETLLVRSILRPGDVFVDVGANWGYYSLLAAGLVGVSGQVIAIEPHPLLFEQLERNLAQNLMGQVVAIPVAACDFPCEVSLEGFANGARNLGISRVVAGAGSAGNTFRVRGEPIDTVLDRNEVVTVDLLKMDIEGAEAVALRGLDLVAGRYRRILLELHPRQLEKQGGSVAEIVALFAQAGYQGWLIDHSGAATRGAARLDPVDALELLTPCMEAGQRPWRNVLWAARGIAQPLPPRVRAAKHG